MHCTVLRPSLPRHKCLGQPCLPLCNGRASSSDISVWEPGEAHEPAVRPPAFTTGRVWLARLSQDRRGRTGGFRSPMTQWRKNPSAGRFCSFAQPIFI
jgi:hypothetical protein